MDIKNTLIELLKVPGAAGDESDIAVAIEAMVKPYVNSTHIDVMGNLIATIDGAGQKVMLAAHMDQIGFIVTQIDEKGFLRVHNVGGIRRNVSLAQSVVFRSGVRGVLFYEREGDNPADTTMTKLFIDIGAYTKDEAEKLVQIGDIAVYEAIITDMGDVIAAPAMDNRAGCAVLVEALKLLKDTGANNTITAVFTAQEEVGLRGARTAAYTADPDWGIAIDVTLSGDVPKGPRMEIALNQGAAIKIMDSALVCSPRIVKLMTETAKECGIPYQREVLTGGGTDSGAIMQTRGGVPAGAISIPCRYVHSPVEAVSMSDMEACAKLLAAVVRKTI